MAKIITIPVGFHPLEITINNTKYVYKEGETVSVPDEVAALVEQYIAAQPVPKPNSLVDNLGLAFRREHRGKALKVKDDGSDVEWGEGSGGGGGLPEISAGDAGKVLTVNQNETEAIWAQSGGIFWITASPIPDYEDVLRLDKTFLEIFNAMRNKLLCVITFDYEGQPTNYEAQHMIVADVGYDPELGEGFVNTYDLQFSCSSVNDYPEYFDNN